MKKIIICVLLIFCRNLVVCAKECNYFNCIILIDGELASPTYLKNGYILIKKPTSKNLDTVKFDYAYGTMLFSDNDFKKLQNTSESDTLSAFFEYLELRPVQRTYDYKIEMDPSWLNQTYLIVKIYNYDKAANKKRFGKETGYGVEIKNALYNIVLPHY